jgi:hypothetical protein
MVEEMHENISPCAKVCSYRCKCLQEKRPLRVVNSSTLCGHIYHPNTLVHCDGFTYCWYVVVEEEEFCNKHLDVENESPAEFTPHLLPARYFLHVNAGAISET